MAWDRLNFARLWIGAQLCLSWEFGNENLADNNRNKNVKIDKLFAFFPSSYIPTRLWGFSGHVQTILQSLIGRVRCPWPLGERVYISLHDGSTLTYDLYQPLNQSHEEEITVAVCPGVGNSSESVYIRTFVHYAQCHGYRIAVLNHIGVIDTIQVTSPRIFTYGKFTTPSF